MALSWKILPSLFLVLYLVATVVKSIKIIFFYTQFYELWPASPSHHIMISELPVLTAHLKGWVRAVSSVSQIDSTPLHTALRRCCPNRVGERRREGRCLPLPVLEQVEPTPPFLPPSLPPSLLPPLPNTVCLRLISKNYRLSRTISVRQKIDHNDLNFPDCFVLYKGLLML